MKVYASTPRCTDCGVEMFFFEDDRVNKKLIYRCPVCGKSGTKSNDKPRSIVDSNKTGLNVGKKN